MPPGFRRPSRAFVATVVVLAVAGSIAGCGRGGDEPRDGLEPDTARFTYGGRSAVVPLADCGREGDVVVAAGARGAIVVQVEADLGEGGFARTGVTADLGDDGILGAFGADMEPGAAGEITDVRVEGDRLTVEGRWVAFDEDLVAQPDAAGTEGRVVVRCPETDDDLAAPAGPESDDDVAAPAGPESDDDVAAPGA